MSRLEVVLAMAAASDDSAHHLNLRKSIVVLRWRILGVWLVQLQIAYLRWKRHLLQILKLEVAREVGRSVVSSPREGRPCYSHFEQLVEHPSSRKRQA